MQTKCFECATWRKVPPAGALHRWQIADGCLGGREGGFSRADVKYSGGTRRATFREQTERIANERFAASVHGRGRRGRDTSSGLRRVPALGRHWQPFFVPFLISSFHGTNTNLSIVGNVLSRSQPARPLSDRVSGGCESCALRALGDPVTHQRSCTINLLIIYCRSSSGTLLTAGNIRRVLKQPPTLRRAPCDEERQ